MSFIKRLEGFAKRALALLVAAFFFRSGRRHRAARIIASGPRRVLLVRPDNRVGEALLMTPLLSTLKRLPSPPRVDVLLHEKAVRVLSGHPDADEVEALNRRRIWLGPLAPGIRALRLNRYDLVVDCGNWEVPSITSAILSRLVAPVGAVLGPSAWPARWLHDISVSPLASTRDEVKQRVHLLSPIRGLEPTEALSFRETKVSAALSDWLKTLQSRPYAVVNPGGRLGWRRVPERVFAAAAGALSKLGITPVITFGPGEETLAKEVATAGSATIAPPTTLDELAALMKGATLTVCNNTGPMHLSVALGVPTVGLFLRMDMARWGHAFEPHRMIDLTPLLDAGAALEQPVIKAVTGMVRMKS